jgi:hypothetical protein
MPLYFKDRIPDPIHGENSRYYDAIGNNGTVKLSDFKLLLKNNVPAGKTGDPVNAGNLNFASGNANFPAPEPDLIHKGDILSIMPQGAMPARMSRPTAMTGPAFSASQFVNGFWRLDANRILIIYNNQATVAAIDFTNKTVALANTISFADIASLINPSTFCLVTDFDENPSRAVFCVMGMGADAYATRVTTYGFYINGSTNAITKMSNYYHDATYDTGTLFNAVSIGGSRFVVINKGQSTNATTAELISMTGNTPAYVARAHSTSIPRDTAIPRGLYCYDKATGRSVVVFTDGSNQRSIPLNVTGNTIAFGSLANITPLQAPSILFQPGGTDKFALNDSKFVSIADAAGYSVLRIFSINPSTGAVTAGSAYNLPILNSGAGATTVTYVSASRILITGVDAERSPRDACLLDCEINGATLVSITKHNPFRDLRAASDANAVNYMKNAAFENPSSPGEFLFMQQFNASPMTAMTFWFGKSTDVANPNNIVGVAIEEPDGGMIRTQIAGKLLPGIYAGLKPGQLYIVGVNGSLAPYSGAAGTKAIGIATSPTEFVFFGATDI